MMKKKVLVVLDSIYCEDNDLEGAVALDAHLLTDEHIAVLHGSLPYERKEIPGCSMSTGYFSSDKDEEKCEDANLGLTWAAVDKEDIPSFTRQYHCIVCVECAEQ